MKMKLPIYLDYSATTPVDPRVAEKMIPYLCEHFGNPASRSHSFGWVADAAVEEAREQVADLVNADPKEIVWTSGATESNNLAIKGAANFYAGTKGKHIITVKTEHKAVLDPCKRLQKEGFDVTFLEPGQDGIITAAMVQAAERMGPATRDAASEFQRYTATVEGSQRLIAAGFVQELTHLDRSSGKTRDARDATEEWERSMRAVGQTVALLGSGAVNALGAIAGTIATAVAISRPRTSRGSATAGDSTVLIAAAPRGASTPAAG